MLYYTNITVSYNQHTWQEKNTRKGEEGNNKPTHLPILANGCVLMFTHSSNIFPFVRITVRNMEVP